jgi:Tol biopolymer transport system component
LVFSLLASYSHRMISTVGRLLIRVVPIVVVAVSAAVFAVAVVSAAPQRDAANPTWSPDGSEIAFVYVGSSYQCRIVAASAVTGGSRRTLYAGRAADGSCGQIRWAAGGRILFIANYTLMSVPATGGKPTRLFSSTPWFILSPNGKTAAFENGAGQESAPDAIGLVDVRGGKPLAVPKPKNATDSIAGFSPDGSELVFVRFPFPYRRCLASCPSGGRLMVEHLGGGVPVPLSKSGLIGASALPANAHQAQWSPDGHWIAFIRNLKLEVVSTAGGSPRVLSTPFGANFSWSPNSALIAYVGGSNHPTQHLMTVDPHGAHRSNVLGSKRSLRYISEDSLDWPQWSPDGSKLVFIARTGLGYPPTEIWIARADGHGLTRIA